MKPDSHPTSLNDDAFVLRAGETGLAILKNNVPAFSVSCHSHILFSPHHLSKLNDKHLL